MRETWNAARVGLMVVLGLIVTVAVYRYVDERASTDSGYGVHAYFGDVQGLIAKSRVLVAGIPVGYIERIRLDGDRARVDMRIEGTVPVYEDAQVTMRSLSLLGERVLVITPGTPTLPRIPDGGEIRVASEGVQTDDILVTVNDIAQSVRRITIQMERAFGTDEAGERMESALRNLSDALENIKEVTDEAGPRIVRIMENVEMATGDLNDIIQRRKGDIDRGVAEVDDTIASIHQAADQLNAVLEDVKEVSGRTARGEGTLGRLTQDEALIDEVEGVAEGLNNFVGGLNRLRTIVELRSEYNVLSSAFKTYFSIYLKPREGRYFLFQVVDDPRGTISVTDTIVRQSPPPLFEPNEFRRTEISRTNRLKFSAELGKTISFATFRFGIIESTGGLGMDINVLNDRLEFNMDIFDIGRFAYPRLRIRANYEILRRFSILAGIDNIINGGRDYFFGLQLRFDDEDLKPLIPLGRGCSMKSVLEGAGAVAGSPVGFVRGISYAFRGMRFVYFQHPGLARYWLFPIVITALALAGVAYGTAHYYDDVGQTVWSWMPQSWDEATGWTGALVGALRWLIELVLGLLLALVGLVLVWILSSIVAAPFNDALSEAVERILTGQTAPPFSMARMLGDVVRTIRLELLKVLVYAGVVGPLFIVSIFLPGIGQLVSLIAFALTVIYLGIDYVDWPAARREWSVSDRVAFARAQLPAVAGFGTGVWVFLFIPLVNLFFMPAAVAGGTMLFVALDGARE